MNSISQCPECQEWVSLPADADRSARVQCPLCDAEYLLDDVLKNTPPELIMLDVSEREVTESAESEEGTTDVSESTQAATEDSHDIPMIGDVPEHVSVEAPVFHSGNDDGEQASLARRPVSTGSPVKFVRNVVVGGFVGLALGYFVLLWLAGPSADFLNLGSKLPKILLPSSFDD